MAQNLQIDEDVSNHYIPGKNFNIFTYQILVFIL